MNNIKHNVIKTIYVDILESIEYHAIIGGLNGSINLYAEHMDDHTNKSVAEFLQENIGNLDVTDIECILDDTDYIIQAASTEFVDALGSLFPSRDLDEVMQVLNNASIHFDSWGNYYVFAEPVSNACTNWFIIRAENEQEAYSEVVTRFEQHFIIEEEDIDTKDEPNENYQYNDNGNTINTDNLQLVGSFSFIKP